MSKSYWCWPYLLSSPLCYLHPVLKFWLPQYKSIQAGSCIIWPLVKVPPINVQSKLFHIFRDTFQGQLPLFCRPAVVSKACCHGKIAGPAGHCHVLVDPALLFTINFSMIAFCSKSFWVSKMERRCFGNVPGVYRNSLYMLSSFSNTFFETSCSLSCADSS